MKEQIYTIDINDAFDQTLCCPLCKMEQKWESDVLAYILGPAMMEPDIRVETNARGFCRRHLHAMQQRKNKLSLALMLESLLMEINKNPAKGIENRRGTCYLCRRVERFRAAVVSNIAHMWKTEPSFRLKFNGIAGFCLPHANLLTESAPHRLGKKTGAEFAKDVAAAAARQSELLGEQITAFCKSFDHRNAGQDIGEAKSAVERACNWIGGMCDV